MSLEFLLLAAGLPVIRGGAVLLRAAGGAAGRPGAGAPRRGAAAGPTSEGETRQAIDEARVARIGGPPDEGRWAAMEAEAAAAAGMEERLWGSADVADSRDVPVAPVSPSIAPPEPRRDVTTVRPVARRPRLAGSAGTVAVGLGLTVGALALTLRRGWRRGLIGLLVAFSVTGLITLALPLWRRR